MPSFSMKRIRFTIGLCQNNMRQTVIYRIKQSTSNTRSTNSNKKNMQQRVINVLQRMLSPIVKRKIEKKKERKSI